MNLIRKIVWSFVQKHPGLEFDDLFSEAFLACLEAERYYDPGRGSKSTYYWHVVKNRLSVVVYNQMAQAGREQPLTEFDSDPTLYASSPEQLYLAHEAWQEVAASLSPEAQTICSIIIDQTDDLPIEKPRKCRGMIVKSLRDHGWSWASVWAGFREIKQALANG